MWQLELVAADIRRAVKYAENVNVAVVLHQVRDTVVAVQENANVTRRGLVSVSDLRKVLDGLGPVIDPLNRFSCRPRIVRCNVLEDVLEPALCLSRSIYLCHERMRRLISSFEMTRFASESASPR